MKKIDLLKELYETCYENTDSFVDGDPPIGADLAYLMGAILTDDEVRWEEERQTVEFLRDIFGSDHPLWEYVTLCDDPEED